jgi:hypothetical protein
MGDLQELKTPYVEKPLANDNLTTEQLEQQIQVGVEQAVKEQEAKEHELEFPTQTPTVPVPPVDKVEPEQKTPEQVAKKPEPTEPPKTVPTEEPKPTVPPVETPKPVPVEQQLDANKELADLIAKKGYANPNEFAKSYKELERMAHQKAQEVARLQRQQTAQPPQVVQPAETPAVQPEYATPNDQFLADLQKDGIGTMARALNAMYGPVIQGLVQTSREQAIHSTTVELSSSPKTAEFNLPQVQEKMKEIWNEHPDWQGEVAKHLKDVYEIARGRVGNIDYGAVEAGKKVAEQNLLQKQAAGVEGTGKPPAPPQPLSPEQMKLDDLWKVIQNEQRKIIQGQ